MELFGATRSRVDRNHALICPDNFVRAPLTGWTKTQGVILIAPQMGAKFTQYLALMEAGAISGPAASGVERVAYVLEGTISVDMPGNQGKKLTPGGYVYAPPGGSISLRAETTARVNIFEKPFTVLSGQRPPAAMAGAEQAIEGAPFMGDSNALLQVLLPDLPAFDLAVNRFRFQPGAALPLVEVHVMEHGLLMLEGQGIYRLGDHWYPVKAGDVIWMAPFCPQWFVAMGTEPASYLYFKDVNRDPLSSPITS
jgi:(S)-ureidoglycine aminohydrolase